jgi:hypothetical protein
MITREDVEKAFSEPVQYSPAPWRKENLSRPPRLSEVEERLMTLIAVREREEASI